VFTWRRLAVEGALTAAGSGERAVPASDCRALQSQVRELQQDLVASTSVFGFHCITPAASSSRTPAASCSGAGENLPLAADRCAASANARRQRIAAAGDHQATKRGVIDESEHGRRDACPEKALSSQCAL